MNHLFHGQPLSAEFELRLAKLRQRVDRLGLSELDAPDLPGELQKAFGLIPVTLLATSANTAVDEAPDHQVLITITVPFRGSPAIFSLQPSQWSLNPPQGSVTRATKPVADGIEEGTLTFSNRYREADADAIKIWRQEQLTRFEQHIAWANQDLQGFSSRLMWAIPTVIEARRTKLAELDQLKDALR